MRDARSSAMRRVVCLVVKTSAQRVRELAKDLTRKCSDVPSGDARRATIYFIVLRMPRVKSDGVWVSFLIGPPPVGSRAASVSKGRLTDE